MTSSSRRIADGVRGTAELPLIGANLAREAVAILEVDAAVAVTVSGSVEASIVAKIAQRAVDKHFKAIFALNKVVADRCRGLAVGDEASEEENDETTETHAESTILVPALELARHFKSSLCAL